MKYKSNFTLIELMIVVAVIAVIAVIAIPGFLRAKIASNETSAIGSLRSTATAQLQFARSSTKDRDSDGVGEFGYYTELSGVLGIPKDGILGPPAKPPYISTVFGTSSSINLGQASKSGYFFQVFLPSGVVGGPAIPESGGTVPVGGPQVEIDAQELRWLIYAWPMSTGKSGNKAFLISHHDELLACPNRKPSGVFGYSGILSKPDSGDVFNLPSTDLDDPLFLDAPITAGSAAGVDLVWSVQGKG